MSFLFVAFKFYQGSDANEKKQESIGDVGQPFVVSQYNNVRKSADENSSISNWQYSYDNIKSESNDENIKRLRRKAKT